MPKLKTHRGAAKRLRKVAGGAKYKFRCRGRNHILTSKTTKRKRRLRAGGMVHNTDQARVSQMLPN